MLNDSEYSSSFIIVPTSKDDVLQLLASALRIVCTITLALIKMQDNIRQVCTVDTKSKSTTMKSTR